MTEGEKQSASRAQWSDFDRYENPNGKLASAMAWLLGLLAVVGLGFATFAILSEGWSVGNLIAVAAVTMLILFSAS